MAIQRVKSAAAFQGVRRLDPLHDLAQVADVIEEGFGQDLTEPGWRALREMRLMSRLGPLLWWLVATSPDFREYHSGFVWVQEGQIVGTLHITRPGSYARRWLISNVAVRAGYRGQGIARTLMETALAWAQEQDGEAVFLRVRSNNLAAWSLYQGLGFKRVHDAVELRLAQVPDAPRVAGDRVLLAPYRSGMWRQVRDLARAIVPSDLRWLESVSVAEFDLSLGRCLSEWWAGLTDESRVYRLAVQRGGRVVAVMAVKSAGRRDAHHLTLHVHPDCRGQVEEMLVTESLARLWPQRNKATYLMLPIGYAEMLDALKRYGFEEQKTWTLMRLVLGRLYA